MSRFNAIFIIAIIVLIVTLLAICVFDEENNSTGNNFGSIFAESNIEKADFEKVFAEIVVFVGEVDDLVEAIEEIERGGG